MCSPDPTSYRVSHVRKSNPYRVIITRDMYGIAQSDTGTVPAGSNSTVGETFFQSATVINVNGLLNNTTASTSGVR
jgi:hypothetical protein